MKRLTGTMLLLLAMASFVRAHFVYLVPTEGGTSAMAVFSDDLEPDAKVPIDKIAGTEFWTKDASGKETKIAFTKAKGKLEIAVKGKGPLWLIGACKYGVVAKGDKPFLLSYYPRTVLGSAGDHAKVDKAFLTLASDKTPLVIEPVSKSATEAVVRVLWKGKPAVDSEVAVIGGEKLEKADPVKTDKEGKATVKLAGAGQYAIRARYIANVKGEHDGKKYDEERSYATLTFSLKAPPSGTGADASPAVKLKEDPEASKLLADARAARANWDNFPGFTAEVAVNVDGKVERGTVKISDKGKVDLKLDGPLEKWTKAQLTSMVGHRMDDSTTLNTPCAFPDSVTDHPLGRAIRVLNGEHHSSYRIRDRQVIEVNRTMGPIRFTIAVLENRLNEEKKYLPASYVVNTWDLKTDVLRSSVSHHVTWQRIGAFDLPKTAMTITATPGKQETRTITLSGIKLLGK